MRKSSHKMLAVHPLSYAISMALASLVASNAAIAQENKPAPPAATAPAATAPAAAAPAAPAIKAAAIAAVAAEEASTIVVVGTRASQQSAIDRKKNAATAMDSIIAEDVGAFPDRNIGEAISRIAGVALERGDFGEGISVSVRGNGADLTRVEIDGQGVQAAGGTDLNGGGSGRGVEFRQLSSDLIKSVDVVKGSTADMTEGSLGGGIIIKTRTGLDFQKPYAAVRVAASQGSLNKEWSPDLNIVLAKKFLDNRLGVLLNASSSSVHNESHSMMVSSNQSGYARIADFDNSPNKTFAYNPALLSATDPTVKQPAVVSSLIAGGFFNSATPLEILTKSAAAATKADCYTAFPALTTDQQNLITAGNTRTGAVVARGNELISCLAQWSDYTPQLLRYGVKRQVDKRGDIDLRFDFKVNDNLTVYAKGSRSNRKVDDNSLTYGLGGATANPAAVLSPAYNGIAFTDSATGVRTAVPGSGYYAYDTPSFRTNLSPATTTVVNIVPGSVVADANHHLTSYTITDGNANTDQIHNTIETTSTYLQAGGTYKNGGLKVEFFVGDASSDFRRGDKRTNWSTNYGPTTLQVQPNGLWTYVFPATSTFDQTNPAAYATVTPGVAAAAVAATVNNPAIPAYTVAQQALRTQSSQLSFSPQIKETAEKTAKADLTYSLSENVPWITNIKTGFNFRDTSGNSWGGGGATLQAATGTFGTASYVAPIILPTANVRSFFTGCTNTAGSAAAGGNPCVYGYVPLTNLSATLSGTTTYTPAQFQNIIAQSMGPANSTFFNGLPNRSPTTINGWNQIDVEKVFALVGTPNVNFDCVKECTATDGKVYQQPVGHFSERATAGYLMGEFEIDRLPFGLNAHPFGMELSGNFGYRYVRTQVSASGYMTFTSTLKNSSFNPANPTLSTGVNSTSISRPTAIDRDTTDIMPSLNLALWVVPNQVVMRYNRAKTVARPPISSILPTGTCTYDERTVGQIGGDGSQADMGCSGTLGNPGLLPQTNINHNLTLEWYPNKDTMFSAAKLKQIGRIGAPVVVTKTNGALFAGNDAIDPATGKKLSDFEFTYNTWENGAASTRVGMEYASKTAFTFLPSVLKYTGLDLNYSKLQSSDSIVLRDLITGNPLPPANESKYSYNASLWYDDGALSARVALQARASYFTCIAACNANTVNNFPNDAGGRTTILPYNPGSPNFRDATRYIDAKIAYKFKNGVEIFAEGRNLGLSTTSNSQGPYSPFADGTPNLLDYTYAGRRIMIGMNYRMN